MSTFIQRELLDPHHVMEHAAFDSAQPAAAPDRPAVPDSMNFLKEGEIDAGVRRRRRSRWLRARPPVAPLLRGASGSGSAAPTL